MQELCREQGDKRGVYCHKEEDQVALVISIEFLAKVRFFQFSFFERGNVIIFNLIFFYHLSNVSILLLI